MTKSDREIAKEQDSFRQGKGICHDNVAIKFSN